MAPPPFQTHWTPVLPDNTEGFEAAGHVMAALPELRGNVAALGALLQRSILPPSNRWMLTRVGKCGGTTLLRALFHIEFGVPLTTRLVRDWDPNPDSMVHTLKDYGLLFPALDPRRPIAKVLERGPLRIATVRHPGARALSAFRYLCLSNEKGAELMAPLRLHMNLRMGFDWRTEADTLPGFLRFLEFVAILRETMAVDDINTHVEPQAPVLQPARFRYDVLARTEDLAGAIREICARLDTDAAPVIADLAHANATGAGRDPHGWLTRPEVRAALMRAYGDDFETFGYDPEKPL